MHKSGPATRTAGVLGCKLTYLGLRLAITKFKADELPRDRPPRGLCRKSSFFGFI